MKIEIEVKPGTARRVAMIGATFLVLGVAAAVYANQVHFTNGQTLTATDLNTNFDELYAKAAKPSITANGKAVSIGGVFCGATSATYNGAQVGGYTGGKAKCEATCSAATAHMCTLDEMTRSASLGMTLATGWVSAPLVAGSNSGSLSDDCFSWGFASGQAAFYNAPSNFNVVPCTTLNAIACCD